MVPVLVCPRNGTAVLEGLRFQNEEKKSRAQEKKGGCQPRRQDSSGSLRLLQQRRTYVRGTMKTRVVAEHIALWGSRCALRYLERLLEIVLE